NSPNTQKLLRSYELDWLATRIAEVFRNYSSDEVDATNFNPRISNIVRQIWRRSIARDKHAEFPQSWDGYRGFWGVSTADKSEYKLYNLQTKYSDNELNNIVKH